MLSELRIRNFKCFAEEVVLSPGRLNLFTGINSRGKSSALQPLLCFSQTLDQDPTELFYVNLNGSLVSLGAFREVRNRTQPDSEPIQLGFELDFGEEYLSIRFTLVEAPQEERLAQIGHWRPSGSLCRI